MKIVEIVEDWSDKMSYEERKGLFAEYRNSVEELAGYEMPYEKIDMIRQAFLKGLEPDEAAELLQGSDEPERFQQGYDDEDIAGMQVFTPDEDEGNEDRYADEEPDAVDQGTYNREMGFVDAENERMGSGKFRK